MIMDNGNDVCTYSKVASKLMMWCVTSGRGAPGGRHPGRGGPGGAGAAGGALAGHPKANIFKVFQIFLQICIIDVFPNSIQLVSSNILQFSQLHLKRLHILFSIESENFPWPLHPSIIAPAQHISFLHPAQLHSHSTAAHLATVTTVNSQKIAVVDN